MDKLRLVSKLTEFAEKKWAVTKQITPNHLGVWDNGYPCANPDGPVDNSECDDSDPLCNCPCQELKPDSQEEVDRINTELSNSLWNDVVNYWNFLFGEGETSITSAYLKEPTDKQLKDAEMAIKECELIKTVLGEDYLGCLWDDMEHPSSCNCPCVGPKFKDYLEYTRTYSTYWDTPPNQPLLRNAQMMLITSQKAQMRIIGDLTLRPGTMIYIKEPHEDNPGKEKRIGGRWLVAGISHSIGAFPIAHEMYVDLIRDTAVFSPDEDPNLWKSIWELIKSWIS